MTSSMNVANGKKTARACDICITKPALYYCTPDDAFLCHTCDNSVHSANPLAGRHQRVLLKTIATCNNYSSKASTKRNLNCVPSWHRGFTKKPRTPRHGKNYSTITTKARKQLCLLPEVGDTNSHEENGEEQVLYRVPDLVGALEVESQRKVLLGCNYDGVESESLNGFVSSDIELAADIESLLGKGLGEDQCMGMEELGLIDCKEEGSSGECCLGSGKVKVEEENQVEMGRELAFELRSFDNDDSTCEKVGLDVTKDGKNGGGSNNHNQGKRKILLQLDYEAVITAWKSKRSPWTTADKPDFLTDHCMVEGYGVGLQRAHGELFGCDGAPTKGDGDREARVSRYREKRQTRLFSKKIRYKVRKLNAEKKPRIKGRFV